MRNLGAVSADPLSMSQAMSQAARPGPTVARESSGAVRPPPRQEVRADRSCVAAFRKLLPQRRPSAKEAVKEAGKESEHGAINGLARFEKPTLPPATPADAPGTASESSATERTQMKADEEVERLEADDVCDPSLRQFAQMSPPFSSAPLTHVDEAKQDLKPATVPELVEAMVKRIAWSSEAGGKKGTVHMELGGTGPYAGAKVTISAEGRDVRVSLDACGADAHALAARITQRLEARNLRVLECS